MLTCMLASIHSQMHEYTSERAAAQRMLHTRRNVHTQYVHHERTLHHMYLNDYMNMP